MCAHILQQERIAVAKNSLELFTSPSASSRRRRTCDQHNNSKHIYHRNTSKYSEIRKIGRQQCLMIQDLETEFRQPKPMQEFSKFSK